MQINTLFTEVLSMSLTASVVIVLILLVRLPLRRAPKVFSYALWTVVLFRLLCPAALELPFSAVPDRVGNGEILAKWSDDYVGDTRMIFSNSEDYDKGTAKNEPIAAGEPGGSYVVTAADGVSPPPTVKNTYIPVLSVIWLCGGGALLLYSLLSLLRLRRWLVGAALLRDNIYIADHIGTPFVMGLIRPKIYLPSALSESEREYIILHEQCHIRRLDHGAKLLFFIALCIHWFNPLVWLAFSLMGRDMEMSCDEAVLQKTGEDIRGAYSASLLSLSTGKRIISGSPLAFGEGDPKSRIKNVLSFRKPTLWIVIAAAVLCIAVAVLCAVNPQSAEPSDDVPTEPAGEVYITEKCVYMNPLSSFYPVDGDNGYTYLVGEDSFTFVTRSNGLKRRISPVSWGWRELPWTKTQWGELFAGGEELTVSLDDYERLLYQPLDDKNCLILADSQLWMVEMHDIHKIGRQIWSIYTLKIGNEEQAELNDHMSAFAPGDIHDLVSAELQMFYGSFKLTDAESLAWIEEELGTATEVTGGIDSEFSSSLYLTRSDGTVGVVYIADNGWAVFRSGNTCYGWTGNLGAKLWELFGVESEHVETEYNEAGQKLRETSYNVNRIRYVIEFEYDELGRPLKTTVNNAGGAVNTTESEYENGLLLRTVYRSDGEITGSTDYEYDADGDVIKMSGVKPDGTVSSVIEYAYDYFSGEKLLSERTQHTYPNDDPYTQRFEYDEQGQKIRTYSYVGEDELVRTEEFEYTDSGELLLNTAYGPDGKVMSRTEYVYDENGELQNAYRYDGKGNLQRKQ